MKNIAIIPARSGSKGLADKNIKEISGKPLIQYTIEAARESQCFDTVMVSTDCEEYAQIARACQAEVPFIRSKENSGDSASSWDVVREVLQKYKEQGQEYDYVALLQPTSPLRNAEDIKGVFCKLAQDQVENVVSVVEVEHPVQWCFTMPENKSMIEMANSPYAYSRRQDLEMYYRENGAIYLVSAKKIMKADYNFYADHCFGYIMPQERSVDIDTALDMKYVELIINEKTAD